MRNVVIIFKNYFEHSIAFLPNLSECSIVAFGIDVADVVPFLHQT